MARLQIFDGQDKVREVELDRETVSVGREAKNSIVLEDASVSRRHAQIEPTGSFYLVRDTGSTNGTYVNDMLVRVHLLSHGDMVRVGRYLLRLDTRRSSTQESTRVRIESLGLPVEEEGESGETGESVDGISGTSLLTRSTDLGPHLSTLDKLRDAIGYVHGREDLYARTLDFLTATLEVERCSFLLVSGSKGAGVALKEKVRSVAARRREPSETDEAIRIDDRALSQALVATGPVPCHESDDVPEGTAILVPLLSRGSASGVLYVDRSSTNEPFTQDELRLLDLIARQVAVSLANTQLLEDVLEERSKVQAIFTSLTDGVMVVDPDFRITEANMAAAVLLETRDRNLLGKRFFDLLDSHRLTPRPEILISEAREGAAVFSLTRKQAETGGGRQSLTGQITPYLQSGTGETIHVITLRDATEVRRLEQLKSEFIQNVAHKLRTPLTVIQGDVPMLRESLEAPELALELIEEIERNSGRLCHLVDQFIEFTDLELNATADASVPVRTNLSRIIAEALRKKGAQFEAKNIQIENRVENDLPKLYLRVPLMSEAIERILDNCVKFVGPGTKVSLVSELSEDVLKLHFIDQGPGIPGEQLNSVFYVGHQVDQEGTGQVPGAGLGLTIARHIVQEHGGEIRIASPFGSDGGGTRVSLVLPLDPEADPVPGAEVEESLEAPHAR